MGTCCGVHYIQKNIVLAQKQHTLTVYKNVILLSRGKSKSAQTIRVSFPFLATVGLLPNSSLSLVSIITSYELLLIFLCLQLAFCLSIITRNVVFLPVICTLQDDNLFASNLLIVYLRPITIT